MLSTVLRNPVSQDTLKLTITDKDTSDPLVASVTIGEETKDSGIDGVVQFTLAYGDYEATIECEGYTTATEELAFRSNHKNFTVELEAAAPVVTTGTVTVTCLDSEENPLENTQAVLSTVENPTSADVVVGIGVADNTGTCTLMEIDPQTAGPTQTVAEIEFGTYYLMGFLQTQKQDVPITYHYNGTLVVDGDEEVTITLTAPQAEGESGS